MPTFISPHADKTLEQRILQLEYNESRSRVMLSAMSVLLGMATLRGLRTHETPELVEEVTDLVKGYNALQLHQMAEAPSLSDYHKKPNSDGSPRA